MSFGFGIGDFITVLSLANKICKRFLDAPKEARFLDAEVRSLSITLQDAEIRLYGASKYQHEQAEIALKECHSLLLELAKFLGCIVDTGARQDDDTKHKALQKINKLWKTVRWDSEEVKSFQLRIISSKAKFDDMRQEKMQQNIELLVEHRDHQQRSEIIEWIKFDDYATKQRDLLGKRADNSASRWLLESEQFKLWLEHPGQTLFCPGIPGAGKTMTTAVVVEDLQSRQMLTAYVYCTYQDQNQTCHRLFSNILGSLIQQISRTPDSVQQLYNNQGRLGRPMTLEQTLSAIRSISTSMGRVNIIMDALDELTRDDRNSTVEKLLMLQREIPGLSLFLTSRSNPEIEAKIGASLMIETRATNQDVQKYLRANLHRLPRCVKDDTKELVINSITDVVDGMFLLAELHLNSLKNKVRASEVRKALLSLASGSNAYDDAYKEALERIDAQPEEYKLVAEKTIKILITARRPLSQQEVCHALAVDIENEHVDVEDVYDIEVVLDTCAGLVTLDHESDTVRLVHKSTQDYFHRHRITVFPDAEAFMGNTCVIYRRFKSDKDQDTPFYNYATKYWWSHIDMATREQELAKANPDGRAQTGTDTLVSSKLTSELLVELGIREFGRDPTLYSTMLEACKIGNRSLLEGLLDITRFNMAKSDKLLSESVRGQHLDIVKLLLGRGASLSSLDERGYPILFLAIEVDDPEILQVILDFGADLEYKGGTSGETPLMWAAKEQKMSCFKLLIDKANINAVDINGTSILQAASYRGSEQIVNILLEKGADINIQGGEYGTALRAAVYTGNERIVNILLERGADINIQGRDYGTALQAASFKGNERIANILLEKGADINIQGGKYGTALQSALARGNKRIANILIENGAEDRGRGGKQ